ILKDEIVRLLKEHGDDVAAAGNLAILDRHAAGANPDPPACEVVTGDRARAIDANLIADDLALWIFILDVRRVFRRREPRSDTIVDAGHLPRWSEVVAI